MYHPVTTLSFALEYRFARLNPFIYHFDNLILHLLNILLVYLFIKLLSGNKIIAFVVALLFGIHPMHVESVAWVAERKDVLYACFFLLSMIFYIKFIKAKVEEHKRKDGIFIIY